MPDLFQDIEAFHKKFGLEYKGPPRDLPPELKPFRTKFMGEELVEYMSANPTHHIQMMHTIAAIMEQSRNTSVPQGLEKQFDALIDLVYVAVGTAYMQGFDFNAGWERVHAANMAKVRALREEDSVRGSTYDVVKPAGWTAPDLSDLVAPDWPPTMSAVDLADGFVMRGSTGQWFVVIDRGWKRCHGSLASPIEKATCVPEKSDD